MDCSPCFMIRLTTCSSIGKAPSLEIVAFRRKGSPGRISVLGADVEADLREIHLGTWEGGLMRQKIADSDPIAVQLGVQIALLDRRGRLSGHRNELAATFAHHGRQILTVENDGVAQL